MMAASLIFPPHLQGWSNGFGVSWDSMYVPRGYGEKPQATPG